MWNGTMFVDLDWPLNASSLLSASAELLVLHNICGFHDFIQTSAPIEIQWITLIHYKNDVNTENCFQNGGLPPSWIWENWSFGHVTCIGMWFTDSSSPFRISRRLSNKEPRYSQKTIFNMASVRHLEFKKFRISFCQIAILGMEICIGIPNLLEIR